MEQGPYRAAIFGATFLGIGAALCLEPSVILESGERLGAEFAGNHKVCLPKILRPRSTPGKRFAQALLEQGLVDEVGQVHPAPMVPALERLLQGSGASLFLGARVLRVERTANAYR
ncbi:MAG TPA: hypothetical protein PKE04_08240, partial [Clostridia bacterium]|nr:hypothetical protein [Clostridia bacterium]